MIHKNSVLNKCLEDAAKQIFGNKPKTKKSAASSYLKKSEKQLVTK